MPTGPVRRGALFYDPPALMSCVRAASCNRTLRTLPVTSDWKLDVNDALALSNSPGLCGGCRGKPVVDIAYEGLGPEGWTSRYAVSTSVAGLHGGDK